MNVGLEGLFPVVLQYIGIGLVPGLPSVPDLAFVSTKSTESTTVPPVAGVTKSTLHNA